jgi:hypothetical protein
MSKEYKKPITNIYTKEMYKLNSQLIPKKKDEENEGNKGDKDNNPDYYVFPSENCSYYEINENSHSSKKGSVTSSLLTLNPEKRKAKLEIIRDPKNLGKEVNKLIQKNLQRKNAYYPKNNKSKYGNRTSIGTYPDVNINYSTPISKEKNLDKNIFQKVPDNLGKDSYYLNYQKNSIQSNIMSKNKEKSFIDNSNMRNNYLKSRIIINDTLSNTTNKRINNKAINEREPRHYSRINDKNRFNRNVILSAEKRSKLQDTSAREKEILSLLKKTNSSVEILATDFKTFKNNMNTTVRNFGINVNTTFKKFGDKIDTTFKQFSNKINVFTASQDRINRNLLKILNNLAGQHCWR